jgi:hypothetical protein
MLRRTSPYLSCAKLGGVRPSAQRLRRPVVDPPAREAAAVNLGLHVAHHLGDVDVAHEVAHDDRVEALGPARAGSDALERHVHLAGEARLGVLPQPQLAAELVVGAGEPELADRLAEQQVGAGGLGVRAHVVVGDVEERRPRIDGAAHQGEAILRLHAIPDVPGAEREHRHLRPARSELPSGNLSAELHNRLLAVLGRGRGSSRPRCPFIFYDRII